jgi:hypothetical protein
MTRSEQLAQLRKSFPSWSIATLRHYNIYEFVAIKIKSDLTTIRLCANSIDELRKQLEAEP